MNFAYNTGNASYDPTGSIHLIYEEGRNALTINNLTYPKILSFMNDFVLKFAKQKQSSFRTKIPYRLDLRSSILAPYIPSTAEAATEIGTISLSCAWKIDFQKFYGGSGYVLYWMLSWCAMMAFGLVVENVHNLLVNPSLPFSLYSGVISNVATGFYPVELLSNFYKWGLAWPLRHDLIGAKAILFGTKNLLGLNFGVLLVWVTASLVLQPFTIWVQLRKMKKRAETNKREVLERVYKKVPEEERE
ncbi:hypothetical protein BKA64DRAFT_698949 [Cadophora sp. MPI-SDFR-AT-0126]|nr:hypothetical protein BKA64DRAFT_698949 [Leotiomycetes sp. MPI-SDFR-AT-0126]